MLLFQPADAPFFFFFFFFFFFSVTDLFFRHTTFIISFYHKGRHAEAGIYGVCVSASKSFRSRLFLHRRLIRHRFHQQGFSLHHTDAHSHFGATPTEATPACRYQLARLHRFLLVIACSSYRLTPPLLTSALHAHFDDFRRVSRHHAQVASMLPSRTPTQPHDLSGGAVSRFVTI